jgi:hypothetical protein
VIREVQRQEDGNDAKREYAVGDAHRWLGRLVAPERRQRCHSEPRPTVGLSRRRSGVGEYGPAQGDQAKGIALRHLHDAVQADIDVPS